MNYKKYYYFAAIFYLLAVLFHITQNYLTAKEHYINHINSLLLKSVKITPFLLSQNFHNKNMLKDKITKDEDFHNIEILSKQAKIFGVKYIYTMVEDNNKIIFTASSATDNEIATKTNISHFGDSYNDASPILREVFKQNKSAFDECHDKWGDFYALYIPFVSNDGTKYVVGADIDISNIDEYLQNKLLSSFLEMLFYLLIIIPFFLIYRSNMGCIKNELEMTVVQRTHELHIQEKLMFQQAKMASMGEMISNIAHQWRQPLNVITTCASGLRVYQDLGLMTSEKLETNADLILENAEYLSITIDNFRDLFLPDKPKEVGHIEDIFDIVDSMFNAIFINSNIEFIKKVDSFKINTHINQLRQVIVNMVKNATDAIGKDGYILIDAYVDGDIFIKIKDSGGGIPDDIIDKIFEPYFTTKHQSIGTGIGLHMSYQIITEHLGGAIYVKNITFEHNKEIFTGAEFIITLPADILVNDYN